MARKDNVFGKLRKAVRKAHEEFLRESDYPDSIQTEFGGVMHNKLTGLLAITGDLAAWAEDHENAHTG